MTWAMPGLHIIVALVALPISSTSPIRNVTDSDGYEPSFTPNPKGRGTLELLISCSATLMLAIWTVIHPNIVQTPTVIGTLRNKGCSVLLALFAPEFIVGIAFYEYLEARKLVRKVRDATTKEHLQLALQRGEALIMHAKASGLDSDLATTRQRQRLNDAEESLREARRMLDTIIEYEISGQDRKELRKTVRQCRERFQKNHRRLSEATKEAEIIGKRSAFWRQGIGYKFLTPWLRVQFWVLRCLEIETTAIDFTMEDAFFAIMGGYTCSATPTSRHRSEIRIGSKGLVQLYKTGFLSANQMAWIKPEVADRSKTDALAKLIVCIQATWMLINCILRAVSGLPVTLLELNVLIHVVFAVLMYVFWWQKPHNVRQPISLSPKLLNKDICARIHHLASSKPSIKLDLKGPPSPEDGFTTEHFNLLIGGENTRYRFYKKGGGRLTPECSGTDDKILGDSDTVLEDISGLSDYNKHPGLHRVLDLTRNILIEIKPQRRFTEYTPEVLTKEDLELAIRIHRIMGGDHPDSGKLALISGKGFSSSSPYSIHRAAVRTCKESLGFVAFLSSVCLSYSLLHTTAWNNKFPSVTERFLWRLSCGFLLAATPIFIIIWAWRLYRRKFTRVSGRLVSQSGDEEWYPRDNGFPGFGLCDCFLMFFILLLVVSVVFAFAASFVFSRVYIILECFLSIRRLPEGSFRTISWEDITPHF